MPDDPSVNGVAGEPEASEVDRSALALRTLTITPAERGELAARLARLVGERVAARGGRVTVRVSLTRNRSRLVSWKGDARRVDLRVHEVLARAAGADDADALAAFVLRDAAARPRLRAFLAAHSRAIAAVSPPSARRTRARVRPVGTWHDLAAILHDVRAAHFPEVQRVAITWSARSRTPRRHIRLGSWSEGARLIRIHRRLDGPDIPRFFVASIVHHELCHAALGTDTAEGGPRRVHGPEFRQLERLFPEFREARAWERANRRLLLSAP